MSRKKLFVVVALLSLASMVLGWLLNDRLASAKAPLQTVPAQNGERKVLYYRNPMDASVHSDRPMQDNMGMDYLPVYADEGVGEGVQEGIRIDTQMVQRLGIRTAKVARRSLVHNIETVGIVAVDESGITHLNPKVSGWLEQIKVKAVGEPVKQGQLLAEIYAPELVSAQEEYLLALRGSVRLENSSPSVRLDTQALLDAARQRLMLLDVSQKVIQALEDRREISRTIPLLAPHAGVITELNVREGGRITPETRLLSLADLSRVWVNLEIHADQLPFVKQGDVVRLIVPFMPSQHWQGRIDYLYPTLDSQSRTVQARLVLPNPGNSLRPGMYLNARIQAADRGAVLAVPREAVIRNGQENFVLRVLGAGRFLPSEVRLGIENADYTEILEGLQEGQEIVVSGQFLLDAEANIKGAMRRLLGRPNQNLNPDSPPGEGFSKPSP